MKPCSCTFRTKRSVRPSTFDFTCTLRRHDRNTAANVPCDARLHSMARMASSRLSCTRRKLQARIAATSNFLFLRVLAWARFTHMAKECTVHTCQAWNARSVRNQCLPMMTLRCRLPGPTCQRIFFRSTICSQHAKACRRACSSRRSSTVWIARSTRLCAVARNCCTSTFLAGLRYLGFDSCPAMIAEFAMRRLTSKTSLSRRPKPDLSGFAAGLRGACDDVGMPAPLATRRPPAVRWRGPSTPSTRPRSAVYGCPRETVLIVTFKRKQPNGGAQLPGLGDG